MLAAELRAGPPRASYKETDTSFQDLVSAAAQSQQTSGGVFASSVSTNSVQGTIQSTSVSTDMAINGDGYFVMAPPTGQTDNLPVFNSVNYYTRRGDFQMNHLMDYINSGASGNANVSASLNTNGNLVLKTIGVNADTESITVGGAARPPSASASGRTRSSRSIF